MNKKKYKVVKACDIKHIKKIDSEIDGFVIKPKNNVKKKNTVTVNKAKIADKELIKFIINKKIDKKYMRIISLVDEVAEEDDSDGTKLGQLLNEIELFRSILKNKYAKYMELEEYHSLENRLYLMSKEVKRRVMEYEEDKMYRKSSARKR